MFYLIFIFPLLFIAMGIGSLIFIYLPLRITKYYDVKLYERFKAKIWLINLIIIFVFISISIYIIELLNHETPIHF